MKILLVALLAMSSLANANDKVAQEKYDQAVSEYSNRSDADSLETAIALLDQALTEVEDNDLAFQINILKSRSLYFKGVETANKDAKKSILDEAMTAAKTAQSLDSDYAEGFYFYGIALARWAEANGIMESLKRKDELIKSMTDSIDKLTFDGESGKNIDGFGPNRVLGRTYFKLPGFVGGSWKKSEEYLRVAYENAYVTAKEATPVALNAVYLAETLIDKKESRPEGCQILTQVLTLDPEAFNPDRVPETVADQTLARTLKKKYCD